MLHPHSAPLPPPPSLSLLLIRRVACERLLQKFLFKFHFGLAHWSQIQLQLQWHQRVCNESIFRLKMLESFFISLPQKLDCDLSWVVRFIEQVHFDSRMASCGCSASPRLACLSPVGNRIRVSGSHCASVCVTHRGSRKMFAKCWPINYLDSYFAG